MSERLIETRDVTVQVPVYRATTGLPRPWPAAYRLSVAILSEAVVIKGDANGLRGLAVQLLALAGDGVPSGYHDHLDPNAGELDVESTEVILERTG